MLNEAQSLIIAFINNDITKTCAADSITQLKSVKEALKFIRRHSDILYQQCYEGVVEKAIQLIKDFITSGMLVCDFAMMHNIDVSVFQTALDIVKACDTALYGKYLVVFQEQADFIKNKAAEIATYVLNGIKNDETGCIRRFDALDYYMLTELSPTSFMTTALRCGVDLTHVRPLFYQMSVSKIEEEQTIRNMVYFAFEGHEVIDSEKELIIGFLKSINAPVNMMLFILALKRYLTG